jgi:hypothetical protein
MQSAVASALVASAFITYPSAGDRISPVPKSAGTSPRIEMTTDKGPIIELLVRCRQGSAIISYSKLERKFCTPKFVCDANLQHVIAKSCG